MTTARTKTALASVAILLLLGSNAAFAVSTQPLNLSVPFGYGQVTKLGSQFYSVKGGQVAYAIVAGTMMMDPTTTIQYSYQASQMGASSQGSGSFTMTGTSGGVPVSMRANFTITGGDLAATAGGDVLPYDFTTSSSNIQVTIAGSTTTYPDTLAIENPYFNPWGGAITFLSGSETAPDGLVVIAATYTTGNILWVGGQVSGPLSGTLGSTPVSGVLTNTATEFENLVTGSAYDVGVTQFSSMTPSSLNGKGFYSGTSQIPTTGASDCSPPGLPYTCTMTGFQSQGRFSLNGISGTYSTTWTVPAFAFGTTITAQVPTGQGGDGGIWGWLGGLFGL